MLIIADTCSCHKCFPPYYKKSPCRVYDIGGNFTPDTSARVNNVVTDLTAPPHLSTYPEVFAYLEYTFIFEEMLFWSYLRNYSSVMCSVTSYKLINPHTLLSHNELKTRLYTILTGRKPMTVIYIYISQSSKHVGQADRLNWNFHSRFFFHSLACLCNFQYKMNVHLWKLAIAYHNLLKIKEIKLLYEIKVFANDDRIYITVIGFPTVNKYYSTISGKNI